jgi:hypothetical protein
VRGSTELVWNAFPEFDAEARIEPGDDFGLAKDQQAVAFL